MIPDERIAREFRFMDRACGGLDETGIREAVQAIAMQLRVDAERVRDVIAREIGGMQG